MSDKRKTIKELKDERGKIVADQRALLNKAEAENRGMTADENTNYENMEARYDELTDEITTLVKEVEADERDAERKRKLQDREEYLRSSQGKETRTQVDKPDERKDTQQTLEMAEYRIADKYRHLIDQFRRQCGTARSTQKYHEAYSRYLMRGINGISYEDRSYLEGINAQLESRALQADLDASGGYLAAPEQLVNQVIEELDNITFVRGLANVISLPDAMSLGAPSRDTDIDDLDWSGEITSANEETELDFAKRELRTHPLSKLIKVSTKLIRVSRIDIVNYVAKRFAYKVGTVQENAFLNGTGVDQPLGVFTASDAGVDASRDVSSQNTTTAITADGLINCKYDLPAQYRRLDSIRWCFHRDAVKMIRKLKDGEGQYLWKQGLSDRRDTILEIPFDESEYAPNTFTSKLYVGILGAWNYYWIVDSLAMEIQALFELYARTNQNGYICRCECDGAPVQPAAFRRVQLA